MKRPLILAHRGAQRIAPENTLPAFIEAIALGADGVELDVQRTADDVLVVAHDEYLGRTISGAPTERLTSMTWHEVRQRDAGAWFGTSWRGIRPPSLDEVFDALPETAFVNIELKRSAWQSDGLEKAALHFLQPAALHPHVSQVTAELVATAHRHGQQVNVWTVNDPQEIRRMAALGVDAIITDMPNVAKAALEEDYTS